MKNRLHSREYALARRNLLGLAGLIFGAAAGSSALAADLYRPLEHGTLVADRRASRVGDILTVLVYEASSASNTADTSTEKTTGLRVEGGTIDGRRRGGSIGMGDDFTGRGRIARSGRVLAQLSLTVTQVLPNGDLAIAGEQRIDVNGEKNHIRIRGRVRPVDILDNNTVISNRLADAQIDYVGEGHLSSRSGPGWLARVFTWLGL